MAFLTTNPSPYLINVPELQNVINSATGADNELSNAINTLYTYIDTNNATASLDAIGSFTTNNSINVTNTLNLSNVGITFLGSNLLSSNSLNGAGYMAFQIDSVERARLTAAGYGIGVTAPATALDVAGSATLRGGALYVTDGGVSASTAGYIYADADVFATGFYSPSDSALKRDVRPYVSRGLPTPVCFTWIRGGAADIGVLAEEVAALEPTCVQTTPAGTRAVDYAKLVVPLIAEVRALRSTVENLQLRL
jgi:hypothetical protein